MGKRGKRIKKKNRKRKESREINEQKTKSFVIFAEQMQMDHGFAGKK